MASVHLTVSDEAGHQATQDVTVHLAGTTTALSRIAGVHVIQQVASTSELAALRSQILSALAVPGVVAFGVRAPWNTVDSSFAIFDAARDIADDGGKDLTVRFMAGSHTPDRIRNVAPMLGSGSSRYPRPFDSAGLNGPFLAEYEEYVWGLAAWCRTMDVPQLHLSHYAKDWAEFYWGPEVQALLGSGAAGQTAMVNATNALADIGLSVADDDLVVELPMSGHGPLMRSSPTSSPGIAERIAQHIAAEGGDRMLIQGNGWDEDGIWGASSPAVEANFDFVLNAGCLLGVQMIQPYNTYTWAQVFDTATAKQATTAEVYLPSFTGGTSAQLRAECAAWVPNAA